MLYLDHFVKIYIKSKWWLKWKTFSKIAAVLFYLHVDEDISLEYLILTNMQQILEKQMVKTFLIA